MYFFYIGVPKILIFGERRKYGDYTSCRATKSSQATSDEKKRAKILLFFEMSKFFYKKMLFY